MVRRGVPSEARDKLEQLMSRSLPEIIPTYLGHQESETDSVALRPSTHRKGHHDGPAWKMRLLRSDANNPLPLGNLKVNEEHNELYMYNYI